MSRAIAEKIMSESEYLEFESKSRIKHEFMDGEVFSMAGATRKHNLITNNVSRILGNQLENSDCEVYASNFRVKIREGHNVYPDVSVACPEILVENKETTLLNPTVIFEVLSKSTESRDRGDKAEDYFKLDSLKDYVLVSQYRVRVEHFIKQSNNEWILRIYENLDDELILESINCRIPLKAVYLKVTMSPLKLVGNKNKHRV